MNVRLFVFIVIALAIAHTSDDSRADVSDAAAILQQNQPQQWTIDGGGTFQKIGWQPKLSRSSINGNCRLKHLTLKSWNRSSSPLMTRLSFGEVNG
jgi:hypothetical protein